MRRQLVLIAAIGLAPVVVSYVTYHFWPRERQMNYGVLYAAPAPSLTGRGFDGTPITLGDLRGRWLIVTAAGGACDRECRTRLYAGRQARTMQNAERERVTRVWLVTDDITPAQPLLTEHPDLLAVRTQAEIAALLPDVGRGLYLIDPLGNLVLAWPADPDIKGVARDLARLLRASSIG